MAYMRHTLTELYNATNGHRWVAAARWNPFAVPYTSPCGSPPWPGIICDSGGNIVELRLQNAGLTGRLPITFGKGLEELRKLDLSNNYLSGPIPATFTAMSKLQFIDISNNYFHGSLPQSIAEFPHLRALHVSGNDVLETQVVRDRLRARNVYTDV